MAIEILMPALSPTMEDGTLAKWLVAEGDTVQSGDLIAEIETDKATMEFEAVDEGVIGKLLVAEGTANVKVNVPIALILEDGETAVPPVQPVEEKRQAERTPSPNTKRILASPLARRTAENRKIDLNNIVGSGPRGRIVKADLEQQPASKTVAIAPAASNGITPTALPVSVAPAQSDVAKIYADRAHTEIPLDGMRKTIAARLTEAKQTIPHFYLRKSVNLDALLSFRKQLNTQLEHRNIKLSINDFIIKACALALQTVPAANAVWAGDRVLQLSPSDVAVAVAIDGGLFTPVLKDAETKSLSNLSTEMKDLAAKAKNRKLAPHDYQGGSFAISNLGMFGIESFDAVINPPHGAILAVGAGVKKPIVAQDGTLYAATMMSLTLSVDHRVIDGALAALLLNAIVENLENPMAMLV